MNISAVTHVFGLGYSYVEISGTHHRSGYAVVGTGDASGRKAY